MRPFTMMALAIALAVTQACAAAPGPEQAAAVGPVTTRVDDADYAAVYHVAPDGSDRQDGSAERPWGSITHALEQAGAVEGRAAIRVAAGTYTEPTLELRPDVDLFGGFARADWTRDIADHRTVLDGGGEQRIAVGADDARLDGFVLRRGAVRGKGGALLLDGSSPGITNNVFLENGTLAPQGWDPPLWHETAHDGGAIACLNGCAATVERNLFVANTTEIGRGAGFACDNEASGRRSSPRVARNVFLRNVASAGDDPARSGDGGAISFHGYCDGHIVENVVAENTADSKNDAGGVFVSLWSAPLVAGNVIVGNVSGDDAGGLFVGGQEHRYDVPLDPVPPADEYFVRIEGNVLMGNRNGSPTSGAFRATMMSRGVFVGNVTAHNPGGVYTQRSELELRNNTFVEDARHEDEERTAPGPTIWRDNIITGARHWNAPVTDENNCADATFVRDGLSITASRTEHDPARHFTRIESPALDAETDALVGRVVQAGDRWSVVRGNGPGVLEVWGDLSGERGIEVKPTYRAEPASACAAQSAGAGSATRRESR